MEENDLIRDTKMDRISELPESIIHCILSCLRSPVQLVRMSTLSKIWFSLTASFPILDFNIDDIPIYPTEMAVDTSCRYNGYMNTIFFKYVSYTVSRFCEQNQNLSVQTFKLITPPKDPTELDIIDRCVGLILEKGVQKLHLSILETLFKPLQMYRLPNTLLSASSLTSLKICHCVLPPLLTADAVKFKSLKWLHLECVPLDEEMINYLTAGSPLLETLCVFGCYGFKRFCVFGAQNLREVWLCYKCAVETIHIEAPNLCFLWLMDEEKSGPPSVMKLALCQTLKTLYYHLTLTGLVDLSSSFPFLKNLVLHISHVFKNLKLSSNSLRTFVLQSVCDLEGIEINTPNLLLFEYNRDFTMPYPFVRDLSESNKRIECYHKSGFNILWFLKLKQFLNKYNEFKVLKLCIRSFSSQDLTDVEELKVNKWLPFELEHVELQLQNVHDLSVCVAVLDALLWCCRPKSLSFGSNLSSISLKGIVKFAYEKLLQQEDQCQTSIQIVLSSSTSKAKMHMTDLKSLLTTLSCYPKGQIITFIKEQESKHLCKEEDMEIA